MPSYYHQPISLAEVTIHDENGRIETLQPSFDGFDPQYSGKTRPAIGKKYFIHVTTREGKSAFAENQIPAPVDILLIETDSSLFKSNGEDVRMKLQFRDPASTKNFYQVKIIHTLVSRATNDNEEDEYLDDAVNFEPVDPALETSFIVKAGTVFSDELFNGETFEINLKVKRSGYQLPVHSVRVELVSASEEYYRYFNTKYLQEQSKGDPFTQPVQIFSNVEDGIGIFAGFSSSVWKFER
jgi:hypothetical protein